ncbi:sensor domain-containing protein [Streptomyces sp. NBC_01190]|uniref:sensor domain-containing protein n=1 Tax=Streptomyces sp. NBC_01190 TaxID=2903767 RepID=UPI0038678726|nr:sensor domain-containing protein [Streptomyces sp. NBC_01190]
MRKTRIAVATVAVLPALLLAAGCSSGSSGSSKASKSANADGGSTTRPPSSSTASSAPNGKAPLTKAQLTSALVTDADVPGWTVQVSQTDTQDSQDDSTLTTDKPQCQPLADITSSKPKIHRMAFVGAAFAKTPAAGQTTPAEIDQMLVASHAPGDAQKVIDSVKQALGTCTTFNAVDNTGTKTPFAITKGPAVATGDASASYVMTDTADKKSGAARVSVVKTGDTITAYLSVKSAGGAGELPLNVAREQNDKLRAAQGK